MPSDSRQSGQLYNYPDNYAEIYRHLFATNAQTINRSAKEDRLNYFAWLSNRTIQKMWQIKLPLCDWQRTWAKLLSFCQHARNEAYYDLYLYRIQINSRESIKKLSESTRNNGKNQRHKSRANRKKGVALGNKLWHLKWIKPP